MDGLTVFGLLAVVEAIWASVADWGWRSRMTGA
jgi:hypothetical protein